MNEFLSFIRCRGVAFLCTALLLLSVMAVLSGCDSSDGKDPVDRTVTTLVSNVPGTDAAPETVVTEAATETETEAVTEPPVPYYDEMSDAMYHPSTHLDEYYVALPLFGKDHRIYAAYPQTDSKSFNDYCNTVISAMILADETPDTLREGGTNVISVDYTLYQSAGVYSVVFLHKQFDTAADTVTQSVTVLNYNISTDSFYAPLDIYDMTAAAEPLSSKIRAGYRASLQSYDLPADSLFLDDVCTPDPSSFVNIAVDADNLYFYVVYEKLSWSQLICATVPLRDMKDYTWESIEAKKQAEQQKQNFVPTDPADIPVYDLSYAVAESAAVGDDYFDDAVFIGNSLIVGLQRAVPLKAWYFASVGLNISQVFTKELIPMKSGSTYTVAQALETVEFSKVYLMFGINELGWGSITTFINYYGQLIDRIREVNPEAIVYVQSILPVNEEKWAKSRDFSSSINNVAVATFNQKILEMCMQKNVAFVNVGEVLTDETGNLFSEATSDGVHIGGKYAKMWIEYLKTHTVALSD